MISLPKMWWSSEPWLKGVKDGGGWFKKPQQMACLGSLHALPLWYIFAADSCRTKAPFSEQVQYPGSEPEVRANKQDGSARQLHWFLGRACCIPRPSALFLMSLSADRCFKHHKLGNRISYNPKSNKFWSLNPGSDTTKTKNGLEMNVPSCQFKNIIIILQSPESNTH